jgi:hypothetical protein
MIDQMGFPFAFREVAKILFSADPPSFNLNIKFQKIPTRVLKTGVRGYNVSGALFEPLEPSRALRMQF